MRCISLRFAMPTEFSGLLSLSAELNSGNIDVALRVLQNILT